MPERIAFFAAKSEVESFFGTNTLSETLFEPHYNIAPSHHILTVWRVGDGLRYQRVRWGFEEMGGGYKIDPEEAAVRLSGEENCRCVIPISGFYLWKERGKRATYPFFVRLLNESVMAVAGVATFDRRESIRGSIPVLGSCALITTPSALLVKPLAERMPLLLDRELAGLWLQGGASIEEIEKEAGGRFLLSEMSVLRVSNKVGDPDQNSPKLIQPLPK